jgi:hypothetical protein
VLRQYLLNGSKVSTPIPLSGKVGEKYKPPAVKKKKSGFFSKKEKMTWQ